tara:strand:+ start:431 stop:2077 length:1647 start_codon:yes stop_codon:yes gene_type:complete
MRRVLTTLWSISIAGILIRLLRAGSDIGTYDQDIDTFIYMGSQLLNGNLIYVDFFDPKLPTVQYLFAPIALLKSITLHRWISFAYNIAGSALIGLSIKNLFKSDLLLKPKHPNVAITGASILFLLLSQKLTGGLSGQLHTYSNTFLALAFFFATYAETRQTNQAKSNTYSQSNWKFFFAWSLAGFSTCIAISIRPNIIFPCILTGAFVASMHFIKYKRIPGKAIVSFLIGCFISMISIFVPYLFIDNGFSIAWHGAIEAPLQWINTNPERNPSFSKALFFVMNASAAGVCGWMLFIAALPGIWILSAKQLMNRKQRLNILPVASVIYIIGLSYSLTQKNLWWHYQLMGVLPITLFGVIGLISLDSTGKRSTKRLSAGLVLILSIIFAYNILIPEVRGMVNHSFQNNSSESQKVVVQEYNKVLAFIKSLPEDDRQFTSPANFRLHWETGVMATTVGAHPRWSLHAYDMKKNPTTSILKLATSNKLACQQLTDRANRYLIFDETNSKTATRNLFNECLLASEDSWLDISQKIGLTTESISVYQRILNKRK